MRKRSAIFPIFTSVRALSFPTVRAGRHHFS
jgi:hypothetical protein